MRVALAIALLLLSALGLVFCSYFASLGGRMPTRLTRWLSRLSATCGVDGNSCRIVYRTPYARTLGGIPNIAFGVLWYALVVSQTVCWLASGYFPLWWLAIAFGAVTIAVGLYLLYVLRYVLEQT